MLDWLFGRRKKTTDPSVAEAIVKRDQLFVDADAATGAAREAMGEVDRAQRRLVDEYENAERERRDDG